MDYGRKSLSCMPLFSRVDRLDSSMKCLEGKQNLIEERDKKQCVTMDLAMKEAQFKGSLLDRISWLEQRLHKLSMQLENGRMHHYSSQMQTAGETSSRHGCSKKELSCSFPVFTSLKQTSQSHAHRSEYEEKSDRGQQKQQARKKKKVKKEDKTSKRGNKETPPIWPRFKILGC